MRWLVSMTWKRKDQNSMHEKVQRSIVAKNSQIIMFLTLSKFSRYSNFLVSNNRLMHVVFKNLDSITLWLVSN